MELGEVDFCCFDLGGDNVGHAHGPYAAEFGPSHACAACNADEDFLAAPLPVAIVVPVPVPNAIAVVPVPDAQSYSKKTVHSPSPRCGKEQLRVLR